MALPKNFDPSKFDDVPLTGQRLFDPDSFSSPELFQEAEREGREAIVQTLTTRYQRPCHSRQNLMSLGYLKRNGIKIEDIASGAIRIL